MAETVSQSLTMPVVQRLRAYRDRMEAREAERLGFRRVVSVSETVSELLDRAEELDRLQEADSHG